MRFNIGQPDLCLCRGGLWDRGFGTLVECRRLPSGIFSILWVLLDFFRGRRSDAERTG